MNPEQLKTILRSVLVAGGSSLGTFLVTKGYLTADQVASLASQIDWGAAAGFLVSAFGIVWGVLDRRKSALIASVDKLPEVRGVVLSPTKAGADLAEAVPSNTVVTADAPGARALIH